MAKRAPTEDLLDALRELGGDTPPSAPECRDDGEYGPKVYQRRFGGWNDALLAAGYDVDALRESHISKSDLLDDLRETGGDGPPTASEYKERGTYDVDTYQRRFEKWNNALEAAGYDPEAHGRTWAHDDGEVLDRLRRAADDLGHAPSCPEVRAEIDYLGASTVFRAFGTWAAALDAAGLDGERPTYCKECGTEFDTARGWKIHRTKTHGDGATDDVSPASRPRHYAGGWRTAREKALIRDEHECQDCGLTDEEHRERWENGLHVHHIVPYHTFDDPEAAHGLWNLLTLCWRCHERRHSVHRRESYEELKDEFREIME